MKISYKTAEMNGFGLFFMKIYENIIRNGWNERFRPIFHENIVQNGWNEWLRPIFHKNEPFCTILSWKWGQNGKKFVETSSGVVTLIINAELLTFWRISQHPVIIERWNTAHSIRLVKTISTSCVSSFYDLFFIHRIERKSSDPSGQSCNTIRINPIRSNFGWIDRMTGLTDFGAYLYWGLCKKEYRNEWCYF